RRLQSIDGMQPNNVDIRHELGPNRSIDLVAVSDRTDNSIRLFRVNAESRRLEPVPHDGAPTGPSEIYGLCMYRDARTGETYVIPHSKDGETQVWHVTLNAKGTASLSLKASFCVGSQVEGCVADDRNGLLYIGEERVGILRYDLHAL